MLVPNLAFVFYITGILLYAQIRDLGQDSTNI